MLTSKKRAELRSQANGIETTLMVGKSGVTEAMVKTVSDALEARELIKMTVLENSMESPKEVANELAALVDADVVGVVGRKIILYRESVNNKRIEL